MAMATVSNPVEASATHAASTIDSDRIRRDFPVLETVVNGNRLVYLDSAATSHKPMSVVDRMSRSCRTKTRRFGAASTI